MAGIEPQRYRAFVSSTYEDLAGHRAYVVRSLRQAGFDVDPMEDWTASNNEPSEFSTERVAGCDLMVLLVALRRGHVPEAGFRSITELEYAAAIELGLDCLPFLLDEDAPWRRRWDELDRDSSLRDWRSTLLERHGAGFFGSDPTSVPIAAALTRWVQQRTRLADVSASLESAGISADRILTAAAQEIENDQLSELIDELREMVTSFRTAAQQDSEATASLELGMALAASSQWDEAASHFELYLSRNPDDWEVHFLRGVALANTRGAHATQISALRSYGEAIALRPEWLDPNLEARLHTYRGAMLKRLGRMREAESEVQFGLGLATRDYEIQDALYNLACIYAVGGDRASMFKALGQLSSVTIQAVVGNPYFHAYWDDPEFLDVVEIAPQL